MEEKPVSAAATCAKMRKTSKGRKSTRMSEKTASDIHRVHIAGKEIVLVGTAHISQESVETVRRVIESETPETVCVESYNFV